MKNDRDPDTIGLSLVVIVAEKHPIVRASLATFLSYDGYRVFQAENLSAAISFINHIIDVEVLLVDLDMPGWKSILHHALNSAPDALVIATAGVETIPEISDLKQSGIDVCLQKPLVYSDIRRAMTETVGRRRAA
jgi:DNA-binding NarL/FixJ family response regulator